MCDDSDEETPQLSNAALAALEEFYQERAAKQELAQEQVHCENKKTDIIFEENWQLSQFWYSSNTIDVLAKEASRVAGEGGRIALISCPSLYHSVKVYAPKAKVVLLEYDLRFAAYGADFHFYDYNTPLDVPKDWEKSYNVVIADPPFLSAECLTKTALTVRFLSSDKIILCTGAVMAELAERLLSVKNCGFVPQHEKNLANDFICLTNYDGFSVMQCINKTN